MSADKSNYQFDVWLTAGKMVYRSVPYTVVTDWIQQGRLLEDDHIRPAGTEQWFVLGQVPAFAGYIPKNDPLRTDETAEALEPVESSFGWKRGGEEEEADPDMIPLIDVSLVLLIFFMMTSTVSSIVSAIKVPSAENIVEKIEKPPELIWIGINYVADDQPPRYMIRFDLKQDAEAASNELNEAQVLEKVAAVLERHKVPEVCIAAHRQLSFDLVKRVALEMEKHKSAGKVNTIRIEVGEK